MTIQLHQRNDGSGSSAGNARRLQIEVPSLPSAHRRLGLSLRSSVLLSDRRPGESRAATRIRGRLAGGAHLAFTCEADLQMLGSRSIQRLSRLTTSTEIPLSRGASLTVGNVYIPNDRTHLWKRIEIRFTRSISFKEAGLKTRLYQISK